MGERGRWVSLSRQRFHHFVFIILVLSSLSVSVLQNDDMVKYEFWVVHHFNNLQQCLS